jgi:chemotaxis protein MotD
MMDQVVSGLPQPQQANNSYRDRQQAASEDGGKAENFEDVVSKAGSQNGRNERKKGADEGHATPRNATETPRGGETITAKTAFDLTIALRNVTASADGRAKLANFKDALKGAEKALQPAESEEAMLARLVQKLKQAAEKADEINVKVSAGEASDASLTPADELSLLLGLSPTKETEGRTDKKAGHGASDSDEADEKADTDGLKSDAKAIGPDAHQLAAAADTRHARSDGAEQKTSGDEVVRLVSADGRGRSVDVSLPKVAGEPAAKDTDKSSAATKVETATVLEARRYLGFSADSNATTLSHAVKADPTWTSALQAVQNVDLSGLADTVKEVNTLKLQMNPENLGNMVASLKLKGEELTVEVRVDSVDAYRQLSSDHDEIVKALQDQGFTIDKVTVQLNATERTDTGADRDMQRQGQAQRDEQGGQSNRNNARDNSQPEWASGRDGQDPASGDGAEPGRAGNIYL